VEYTGRGFSPVFQILDLYCLQTLHGFKASGANREISSCAADDLLPLSGRIDNVIPNGSSYDVTVELFESGVVYELTKSGTVAVGDKVEAASATAVRTYNTNGSGRVISFDDPSGKMQVIF